MGITHRHLTQHSTRQLCLPSGANPSLTGRCHLLPHRSRHITIRNLKATDERTQAEEQQDGSRGQARQHQAPDTSVSTEDSPIYGVTLALLGEVQQGTFWAKCGGGLRKPPWGLNEVIKVMQYGVPLGVGLTTIQLLQLLQLSNQGETGSSMVAAADASEAMAVALQAEAIKHLGQETLLVGVAAGLLWVVLGHTQPRSKSFFNYSLTPQWAVAVAALCAILFPVVDPLLYTPWNEAVQQASCLLSESTGGTCSTDVAAAGLGQLFLPAVGATAEPGTAAAATAAVALPLPFKETLLACVQSGNYLSLSMHLAASCMVGPLWEETFWRGFILPSMASRLPNALPLAVALSSTTFAMVHLSPAAGLPILILSSACDMLYLRSGSIGPPLLLHALWNSYQLLAVAFFGKEAFV